MENKPRVFRALSSVVVAGIVFSVLALVISVVAAFLILNNSIVEFLFARLLRETFLSGDILVVLFSVFISSIAARWIMESIGKEPATISLAFLVFGILIAGSHIVFLIMNLISGESVWGNIAQILSGIYFATIARSDI